MFRAKDPIIKQIEKIAVYAAKLTSIIRKKTYINSNYVLYEFLFYFYSLDIILFSQYQVPDDIIKNITNKLFLTLEATNKLEYDKIKSIVKITCFKRYKTYLDIFNKYNKKFCGEFFSDCFMYLSELLVFIQDNKTFSTLPPSSYEQWIKLSVINDDYFIINKILSKHINIFLKFIKI